MNFADLGLIEPLPRTLHALGYSEPTAVQQQVIPAVLDGVDLMAAAQTGTGKTASFTLPLLQRLTQQGPRVSSNCIRALILVPTRELAEQLFQALLRYGEHLPLRSQVVYGGVSINPQMMALRKGADVLVATPGRLLDLHRQNAVRFSQLQCLVLDEADRMLDLGFTDELQQLLATLPDKRQTLLFSATLPETVRQLAKHMLNNPQMIDVSAPNSAAENIRQLLISVDRKAKTSLLLHLLQQRGEPQTLVFVKTRKAAEQLVAALQDKGLLSDSIHGERTQPARQRVLEQFKSGAVRILVATDLAARGIDISDLPLVVNYDLPLIAEDYIHRIGRTGRAKACGEALSLVSADEIQQLSSIEALLGSPLKRHEEPGFVAEHRLPATTAGGQVRKKPKKPKRNKTPEQQSAKAASSRIHLGNWLDSDA
ncbi:MAG: DEAD/DEAH box helicase [Pseudomonas sp.]